jgi:hypothetical protein
MAAVAMVQGRWSRFFFLFFCDNCASRSSKAIKRNHPRFVKGRCGTINCVTSGIVLLTSPGAAECIPAATPGLYKSERAVAIPLNITALYHSRLIKSAPNACQHHYRCNMSQSLVTQSVECMSLQELEDGLNKLTQEDVNVKSAIRPLEPQRTYLIGGSCGACSEAASEESPLKTYHPLNGK